MVSILLVMTPIIRLNATIMTIVELFTNVINRAAIITSAIEMIADIIIMLVINSSNQNCLITMRFGYSCY